jgi:hypothetical protein
MEAATRERLADLVAAHDGGAAETDLSAVLTELDESGGAQAAGQLAGSTDPADRRLAARLMQLLPDASHVAVLDGLVTDRDPRVAKAARRSLRTQRRTPEWRATVERLAASGDPELRRAAQGWLEEGRR